jgi:hypothetical protein
MFMYCMQYTSRITTVFCDCELSSSSQTISVTGSINQKYFLDVLTLRLYQIWILVYNSQVVASGNALFGEHEQVNVG